MSKLEEYFKGDSLAASVWKSKYAIEGEETPDDMHMRMAVELARVEDKYELIADRDLSEYGAEFQKRKLTTERVYDYFKDFKYIVPQGSIMSMLGNKYKIGSLSNCFVIGQPYDSYGGIMQKDQELVQLMKRRGGVGIDISTLRPNSTKVSNAAGSSTGAVSFMHRYSNSTREVAQNGRRGALMITIDCRHPDLLDFINVKKDLTNVTGANISIRLRDDFMQAVKDNGDYILRFPCEGQDINELFETNRLENLIVNCKYNELHTVSKDFHIKKIKAREYFDKLVENNWLSAEPGSMFVDRHWNYSPDGVYPQYRGITTNPCGEIFMQMYDACRLLALNLFSIVRNPFTKDASIDYDKLYEIAYVQQRLADNIVDLEIEHIDRILNKINEDNEPEEIKRVERELWTNIRRVAASGRRTGCGFTGLGDMLAGLGIKYDSKEAKSVIEEVCKTKFKAELDCTIDLGILRGTFDGWDSNLEYPITYQRDIDKVGGNSFYEMLHKEFPEQVLRMTQFGRRNISWNTVAPTGTVSLLTQTTSGLEPLFAAFYFRNKKVVPGLEGSRVDFTDQNGDSWMTYPVLHPKFKDWIELNWAELLGEDTIGSVEALTKESIQELFEKSPWYGSCANDIDWLERVEIQGIIQRYTTHSISSTINLPNDVSKEVISDIYLRSWESGLKGVTIYRDGCRTGVLVTDNTKKKDEFQYHDAPKRPKDLPCEVFTTTAKGKKWNVIVGLFDKKPFEVFAIPHFTNEENLVLRKMAKGRYDLHTKDGETYSENITSEMNDEESALTRMISTALRHGSSIEFITQQLNKSHGTIVSFSKAIARVLSKFCKKIESKEKCPECNEEALIKEEGCTKCTSCGHSRC